MFNFKEDLIMFDLAIFIKNGFIAAVGKMADYQIILNATIRAF